MSSNFWIGKAKEAFLGPWRGFFSTFVGPFMSVVVAVTVIEAREGVLLVREALPFLEGTKWSGRRSGRHTDRWRSIGIHGERVEPLLLGGVVVGC